MALPPQQYGAPRGAYWNDRKELDRFPPTYKGQEEIFEEYMANKSMAPNHHAKNLTDSSGLLELHYNTMRKKQKERAAAPAFIHGPTMTRSFMSTAGYGGFIPGKESCNIVGCTFAHGSRIAHETRGKFYDPPMSGTTFSLSGPNPCRPMSQSMTNLDASGGLSQPGTPGGRSGGSTPGSRGGRRSPSEGGGRRSMPGLAMDKVDRDY